jgi:hypothetical protein
MLIYEVNFKRIFPFLWNSQQIQFLMTPKFTRQMTMIDQQHMKPIAQVAVDLGAKNDSIMKL